MRTRRGVTLLELMITIAIVAILTGAVTQAFIAGLNYETRANATRERFQARDRIENKIIELLQQAYIATDQTDTTTFFEATNSGETSSNGANADTLEFTIQGGRVPGQLLASTDDFETLNERYGAYGGTTEIGLSTSPVGDAADKTGLFIRQQHPSDSEPTQGGTESVLDPDITSIQFEFWDGTAWQPTWTTEVGAEKRLPAAVRVTYDRTENDVAVSHTIIVRLPLSDVTADNPAPQAGGTGVGQ